MNNKVESEQFGTEALTLDKKGSREIDHKKEGERGWRVRRG